MTDVGNLLAERYGWPAWWSQTVPRLLCVGCGTAVVEDESCLVCAVKHAAAKRRTRGDAA